MEFTSLINKLSKPAQRAIINSGITTMEELAALTEKEVARWHGIGPNALITLRAILAENGLSFYRSPDKEIGQKKQDA